MEDAQGLYRQEPGAPYRWTSSRVTLPLRGPAQVELTLGAGGWPGRPAPTVTLHDDTRDLVSFTASERPRSYELLVNPRAGALQIRSPVAHPPADGRWLGVKLFALRATATATAGAFVPALLAALGAFVLATLAAWALPRAPTLVLLAAILLVAFALRTALLTTLPPGFSQDEAVSLVDAWNLAHTGHDHLGNPLPLGAFEAFGDWIAPLLTYLELPFAAIFGPTPLVGRALTAVLGTLAVAAIFGLSRELGLPRAAALAAAFAAALSPWQIALSRHAIPPSLVALTWTLCLWTGVRFVKARTSAFSPQPAAFSPQPSALAFALTAGVAVYAYPTMKMAVPLFVGAAVLLALLRHGWRAARGWLAAGALLALLWLPFAWITLFNPVSSTRFNEVALVAATPLEWLARWWQGYSVYFQPGFYYITGEPDLFHGPFAHGVALSAEAPLVLLGIGLLLWRGGRFRSQESGVRSQESGVRTLATAHGPRPTAHGPRPTADWLVLAALLIAPLPASVTTPSPYSLRASTIAPLYALLVGLGAALLWWSAGRLLRGGWRRALQLAGVAALAGAMAWQCAAWYRTYIDDYPAQAGWLFQDGLSEALRRAVGYAPAFDEVWVDQDSTNQPHIYLLALQSLPPAVAQQQIEVLRRPNNFNVVTRIGAYVFRPFKQLTTELPTLEAVPRRDGEPAFLLQTYEQDGKRILLVRRALE